MRPFILPGDTYISSVQLRVADLNNSLAFYQGLLGFRLRNQTNNTAYLSASGDSAAQVVLVSNPAIVPKEPHSTGLYHVAIRVPERLVLGKLLNRLIENRWPIYGGADHLVSEALYFADQDGNGIEVYVDKPKETWPMKNGSVEMASEPLNFRELLNEAREEGSPWTGIHPGTDIGHIHLQVSDLRQSERFYHEILGFEVTQRNYPGALFLSAGGYHHHVGLNVWNSRGTQPSSTDHAGLIAFELCLPNEETRQALLARLQEANLQLMASSTGDHPNQIMVADPDSIQLVI